MKKIERKNKKMMEVETKLGGDIEEILRYLYVDKNLSLEDMSKILNISYVTVFKWLQKAGIYSRRIDI